MKKKKLVLKKEAIANLSKGQMNQIMGGGNRTTDGERSRCIILLCDKPDPL